MCNLTQQVIDRIQSSNPRTQYILRRLIHHLHAFVKDVQLTEDEWATAIDFLTRTGQKCNDKRQEFILLSDVLGVTMLVDSLQHPATANNDGNSAQSVTETTVKGPFYAPSFPMELGANIAQGPEQNRGEKTIVQGVVKDAVTGQPIAQAKVDVWQSDDRGNYDIQQPEMQNNKTNLRGHFYTGPDGKYSFCTIKPASYPIPTDGPVGEYMKAAGCRIIRPAHIHFQIDAPGYDRLVTHLFVKGDPHLEADPVFGVKDSLIVDFVNKNDGTYQVDYDFGLTRGKVTNP